MLDVVKHPATAVAHYPNGGLAFRVGRNTETCAADYLLKVYDRSGRLVDTRGAASLDDGATMGIAVASQFC